MRKCYYLLFFVFFIFNHLLSAQQKVYESPKNVFRIKLKEGQEQEFISRIVGKKSQNQVNKISQVGLSEIDQLNEHYEVLSISPLFKIGGRFEKRQIKHGLHLWYEVILENEIDDMSHLFAAYKGVSFVQTVEQIPSIVMEDPNFEVVDKNTFNKLKAIKASSEEIDSLIFNDPFFQNQWALKNIGGTIGREGADINIFPAWKVQSGSPDVIVSVHDTGIDLKHPDLVANLWINTDEIDSTGIDDDDNGYVDDIHGYNFGDRTHFISSQVHGTHVAGTIAATNNNGIGVSSVAGGSGIGDGVRIMVCEVFGLKYWQGFEESFVYAADNGAIISQNSWGYISPNVFPESMKDAIDYFINYAGIDENGEQIGPMKGGLVIFSASNEDDYYKYYPAAYDEVISVASSTDTDEKSYFSNFGDWVDVVAPGSAILSTFPDSTYASISGTSMACPHVSGLAALLVSEFRSDSLTPLFVKERIIASTDPLDIINPYYPNWLGSGRINAKKALVKAGDSLPSLEGILDINRVRHNKVVLDFMPNRDHPYVEFEFAVSSDSIFQDNFDSYIKSVKQLKEFYGGEVEVDGLDTLSTYYLAVRGTDIFGNQSPISKNLNFTTELYPEILIDSDTIEISIRQGEFQRHNIPFSNLGKGILDVDFLIQKPKLKSALPDSLQVDLPENPIFLVNESSFNAYKWYDSRNGQIDYEWIDIEHLGEKVNNMKSNYFFIDLPWRFPFYDHFYNELDIKSPGFISFIEKPPYNTNRRRLGVYDEESSFIAPFLVDLLEIGVNSGIYYLIDDDKVIIQYNSLSLLNSNVENVTFQTILYKNGDIRFNYKQLPTNFHNYTVGLESIKSNNFIQLSSNYQFLENEMSILFEGDDLKMRNPNSNYKMEIQADETSTFQFELDAAYAKVGLHHRILKLKTNDPTNSEINLPVKIEVISNPLFYLDKDEFRIPSTFIGESDSISISIYNPGNLTLDLNNIKIDDNQFQLKNNSLSIEPFSEKQVEILLKPTSLGQIEADFEIQTNTWNDNFQSRKILSYGKQKSKFHIDSTYYKLKIVKGDLQTIHIPIENSGEGDLTIEVNVMSEVNFSSNLIDNTMSTSILAEDSIQIINNNFSIKTDDSIKEISSKDKFKKQLADSSSYLFPSLTEFYTGSVHVNDKLFLVNNWESKIEVFDLKKQEIEKEIYIPDYPISIDFDGEFLWITCSNGDIRVYTEDFELVDVYYIKPVRNPSGIKKVGDNYLVYEYLSFQPDILRINKKGEVLSVINTENLGINFFFNLAYNPTDINGNFWTYDNTYSRMFQLDLKESHFEIIGMKNYLLPSYFLYNLSHNGDSLFYSPPFEGIRVYNDAIERNRWLGPSIKYFNFEPNSKGDISMDIIDRNLDVGTYFARLNLLTNDETYSKEEVIIELEVLPCADEILFNEINMLSIDFYDSTFQVSLDSVFSSRYTLDYEVSLSDNSIIGFNIYNNVFSIAPKNIGIVDVNLKATTFCSDTTLTFQVQIVDNCETHINTIEEDDEIILNDRNTPFAVNLKKVFESNRPLEYTFYSKQNLVNAYLELDQLILTPIAEGVDTLIITASNACLEEHTELIINVSKAAVLATNEYLLQSIQLLPNPANSYLNLKGQNMSFEKIQIVDTHGKMVKSLTVNNSDMIQIDVNELSNGIYFLQIHTSIGIRTMKFVKR